MADSTNIGVFAAHAGKREYLQDLVRLAGFMPVTDDASERLFSIQAVESGLMIARNDGARRTIKTPVRAAEAIGLIRKMAAEVKGGLSSFPVGDGILDVRDGLWLREGDAPLRLTEKEVAILVTLKNAKGKPVSRQTLLDEVWAYAQGVETHTLETHIYRLRQKIETDPAAPKIIVTQEDGYSLGQQGAL